MTLCDDINFVDFLEGRCPAGVQSHIAACPRCQKELEETGKLIRLLAQEKEQGDDEIDMPEKPLPETVRELIRKRKKQWLEKRAEDTADKLGYDGKKKDNMIRLMTGKEPDRFLNAAFSDDLLKGKRKGDHGDKDDKE